MSKIIIPAIIIVLIIVGAVTWIALTNKTTVNVVSGPVLSVQAYNKSRNTDLGSNAVYPNLVVFTLTAENPTGNLIPGYSMNVDISQIAENSTLIDAGGASYNSANNSLVWSPLDIPANQSIQNKFTVKIKQVAAGAPNNWLSVKFNNELKIAILPPVQPLVSGANSTDSPQTQGSYKAPGTGTSENIVIFLAILATIGGFLARNKLKIGKI